MGRKGTGMGTQWDWGTMRREQNGRTPTIKQLHNVPTPTALSISYVKYFWNLQAI